MSRPSWEFGKVSERREMATVPDAYPSSGSWRGCESTHAAQLDVAAKSAGVRGLLL